MNKNSADATLTESILAVGGKVIDMPDEKFEKWATTLSVEQIDVLLEKHRSSRNFYKKILQEEYRKKHPNSWRYEDAESKVVKYNNQGKTLSKIKKSKS